jgi:hypothetical protein
MMNILQKNMCKVAGFDNFIVNHCSTQYNSLSSIGIFFIFQYLVIFISSFVFFNDFVYSNVFTSILSSIVILFFFIRIVRIFTKQLQKVFKFSVLIVILFINVLILLIITTILNLKIFETEIFYDLIIKGDDYGNYKIIKHLFSLYYQVKTSENAMVIILFWIAKFLLLQFIFIKPYFQIYSTRKTIYNTIRKNYEQNF